MNQIHLDKNSGGMAFTTACGRNILRTPLSSTWAEFKASKPEHRCEKCEASKHAAFLTKCDAKALSEGGGL